MKLGIFDSGIGGEAIAEALKQEFPDATFQVVNDRTHLPYGDKTPEEIRELTDTAIQPLIQSGSDVIVIACNSATTAAIDWLRRKYPEQKFIGIEPMIKPAAKHTKTGVIAVCATTATLASQSYQTLRKRYAGDLTVLEPDCSAWAKMIEDNQINETQIAETLDELLEAQADVIVLGCTHYHWIKDFILDHVGPDVAVLEPSEAIGRRVKALLQES
ncbi:MAG TPA: aspartate/glutamate racemase family protein [Candidatus Saccharimonadales bacterium]